MDPFLDYQGALPQTVESVLEVFPLRPLNPKKGQKRNISPLPPDDICPPLDLQTQHMLGLDLLQNILSPDAEDQLGTLVDRIAILPPAIKIRKQINAFHRAPVIELNMAKLKSKLTNVKALVRKADPTKVIFTEADKKKLVKQMREKRLREKPLMPARVYTYMPLNRFHVKLCEPYVLFNYQERIIQWFIDVEKGVITHPMWTAARGGLASIKMGLGKTIMVSTLLMNSISEQRSRREPTLYVCPFNLIGNVYREFDKFFGNQLKIMVYHSNFLRGDFTKQTMLNFQNVDVVLTNYSTVAAVCKPTSKSVFKQVQFFRVILDESDEIRNNKTSRFKAVNLINAERRWAMTGTPYHNSMRDYFAQLYFTGFRPKRLIMDPKTNAPRLKYDRAHFYKWNLKQMIKLVRYEDVKDEYKLPEEEILTHYFNLTESLQVTQVYNAYAAHTRTVLDLAHSSPSQDRPGLARSVNNGFFRLLQICTAPHLIIPAKDKVKHKQEYETDETVIAQGTMDTNFANIFKQPELNEWVWNKHGTAGVQSPKMREFINVLRLVLPQTTVDKQPAKAIIFGNFTGSLRIALEAGKSHFGAKEWSTMYRFIHGGISNSKVRWQLLTEFRTNPQCRFLFMTLPMGKVGLNIVEANHVIFLEPWYSWASIAQGIGRARRIGQLNKVFVHFLIARNSTEENVLRLAMGKRTESSEIEAAVNAPPTLKDYGMFIQLIGEDVDMKISESVSSPDPETEVLSPTEMDPDSASDDESSEDSNEDPNEPDDGDDEEEEKDHETMEIL